MQRQLTISALTLAALLCAACGGEAPTGVGDQASAMAQQTAPDSVAEMDLPGCEDLRRGVPSGPGITLARHPLDPALVVVSRDGLAVCVGHESHFFAAPPVEDGEDDGEDPERAAKHLWLEAGEGGEGHGGGLVSDDPIPIINKLHGGGLGSKNDES